MNELNKVLLALPNIAGIGIYFLECTQGYIQYDEVKKDFFNMHLNPDGYSKFSMSGQSALSPFQKSEVMLDIEDGAFMLTRHNARAPYTREILLRGGKL